jgi:hypothetical protein
VPSASPSLMSWPVRRCAKASYSKWTTDGVLTPHHRWVARTRPRSALTAGSTVTSARISRLPGTVALLLLQKVVTGQRLSQAWAGLRPTSRTETPARALIHSPYPHPPGRDVRPVLIPQPQPTHALRARHIRKLFEDVCLRAGLGRDWAPQRTWGTHSSCCYPRSHGDREDRPARRPQAAMSQRPYTGKSSGRPCGTAPSGDIRFGSVTERRLSEVIRINRGGGGSHSVSLGAITYCVIASRERALGRTWAGTRRWRRGPAGGRPRSLAGRAGAAARLRSARRRGR